MEWSLLVGDFSFKELITLLAQGKEKKKKDRDRDVPNNYVAHDALLAFMASFGALSDRHPHTEWDSMRAHRADLKSLVVRTGREIRKGLPSWQAIDGSGIVIEDMSNRGRHGFCRGTLCKQAYFRGERSTETHPRIRQRELSACPAKPRPFPSSRVPPCDL
jgi:hypothetical protein